MVYLNEQKVTTLQEAAVLAEEFALTHKSIFVGKHETSSHEKTLRNADSQPQQPTGGPPSPKSDRQCFYCHKTGHVIADCLSLKREQQPPQAKQVKGLGLIKTVSPSDPP